MLVQGWPAPSFATQVPVEPLVPVVWQKAPSTQEPEMRAEQAMPIAAASGSIEATQLPAQQAEPLQPLVSQLPDWHSYDAKHAPPIATSPVKMVRQAAGCAAESELVTLQPPGPAVDSKADMQVAAAFCDATTATCKAYGKTGAACTSSGDCFANDCVGSVCVDPPPATTCP